MKVIIAGSGISLYFLAKRFISKGYSVAIISRDSNDCEYYTRYLKALVINGDCTNPDHLVQAGVYSASLLIGMTNRDQDNLVVCQMAKLYYQIPRVLAVVNDPDNEEVFSKLGVKAVSNCRFLIDSIENLSVFDEIRQQISVVEGKIIMTELEIRPDARCAGKELKDIAIPFTALVTCILRDDDVIIPRGNTTITAGDHVFLLSLPDNHSVVLNLFS
ncbi:MAG: TrkA family potassium uptake protein [Candidatus Cloacimonadota bacterium]